MTPKIMDTSVSDMLTSENLQQTKLVSNKMPFQNPK